MAHVFRSKSQSPAGTPSTANPTAITHTPGARATVIILSIVYAGGTARTGGAPTIGGITATQADSTRLATEQSVEVWYVCSVFDGTQISISIPNSNSLSLHTEVVSADAGGSLQSMFQGASGNTATGNVNGFTFDVTSSASGDFLYSRVGCGEAAPTSITETSTLPTKTVGYANDHGAYSSSSRYGISDGAGTESFVWVWSADDGGGSAVVFKSITVVAISRDYDSVIDINKALAKQTDYDTTIDVNKALAKQTDYDSNIDVNKIIAKQTDYDTSIVVTKQINIGMATEENIALPVTVQKRYNIGIATEENIALPLVTSQEINVNQAIEESTALPVTVQKRVTIGGTGETPLPTTDLAIYYDDDDLADGEVTTWTERIVGKYSTQPTSGKKPIKSSLGVTFDGNDNLRGGNGGVTIGDSYSLVWVGKAIPSTIPDGIQGLLFGMHDGAGRQLTLSQYGSGAVRRVGVYGNFGSGQIYFDKNIEPNTKICIIVTRSVANGIRMYVNGALVTADSNYLGVGLDGGGIVIGAYYDDINVVSADTVTNLGAFYNKELTQSDVDEIMASDPVTRRIGESFEDANFAKTPYTQAIGNYSNEAIGFSTEQAHRGTYSVKVTENNGLDSGVGFTGWFTGNYASKFHRFYMYFPSGTSFVPNKHSYIAHTNYGGLVAVYTDASGDLFFCCHNDVYASFANLIKSNVPVPFDEWVCIEMEIVYNNPNSGVRYWINGVLAGEDLVATWGGVPVVFYTYGIGGWDLLGAGSTSYNTYIDSCQFGLRYVGLLPDPPAPSILAEENIALPVTVQKRYNIGIAIEENIALPLEQSSSIQIDYDSLIDISKILSIQTDYDSLIDVNKVIAKQVDYDSAIDVNKVIAKQTDYDSNIDVNKVIAKQVDYDSTIDINKQLAKQVDYDTVIDVNKTLAKQIDYDSAIDVNKVIAKQVDYDSLIDVNKVIAKQTDYDTTIEVSKGIQSTVDYDTVIDINKALPKQVDYDSAIDVNKIISLQVDYDTNLAVSKNLPFYYYVGHVRDSEGNLLYDVNGDPVTAVLNEENIALPVTVQKRYNIGIAIEENIALPAGSGNLIQRDYDSTIDINKTLAKQTDYDSNIDINKQLAKQVDYDTLIDVAKGIIIQRDYDSIIDINKVIAKQTDYDSAIDVNKQLAKQVDYDTNLEISKGIQSAVDYDTTIDINKQIAKLTNYDTLIDVAKTLTESKDYDSFIDVNKALAKQTDYDTTLDVSKGIIIDRSYDSKLVITKQFTKDYDSTIDINKSLAKQADYDTEIAVYKGLQFYIDYDSNIDINKQISKQVNYDTKIDVNKQISIQRDYDSIIDINKILPPATKDYDTAVAVYKGLLKTTDYDSHILISKLVPKQKDYDSKIDINKILPPATKDYDSFIDVNKALPKLSDYDSSIEVTKNRQKDYDSSIVVSRPPVSIDVSYDTAIDVLVQIVQMIDYDTQVSLVKITSSLFSSYLGTFTYDEDAVGGGLVAGSFIFNEIKTCNGILITFTTTNNYLAGTLAVYLNGMRLIPTIDYNETGANTFELLFDAPLAGERILVDYIKA